MTWKKGDFGDCPDLALIKDKREENRVDAPGATRPSKKNHQGL